MFDSVANVAGPGAVGVLLSGMGRDGARGLLAMRNAGAVTFVQDEPTSAIFGMPKAALDLGAAERAYAPVQLARAIMRALRAKASR